jgi:hypothetical protein
MLIPAKGKLTDNWPEDIVRLVGKIGIAFAQLEYAVFALAKRLDGRVRMVEFTNEKQHRGKKLEYWCGRIEKADDDSILAGHLAEAQTLGRCRNALFHGIWFRDSETSKLVLTRVPPGEAEPSDIPLDPAGFGDLLRRIRATRDGLWEYKRR